MAFTNSLNAYLTSWTFSINFQMYTRVCNFRAKFSFLVNLYLVLGFSI